MSYLVLARKWRPQTFADLVGQDHVSRTLGNAIAAGRVAHAFLFTGVRGVGKTTSARIMAKAMNCEKGPTATPCLVCSQCVEITAGHDLDVQEIDGASYNGVDEVRRLQETLVYRPARDRFKIFIVDEVHMLSQSAWNAFLKTLEEPPPHVKFIFATTEVHKVPVTILSRCQRYDFKLIPAQLIAARLRYVLGEEKIQADDAAVSLLAREGAGSMRDAMSLLDQAIAWGGDKLVGEDIARVLGVAGRSTLTTLVRALVEGNPTAALEVVGKLTDEGYDLPHVARDLLSYLRDVVVAKVCAEPGTLLDLADDEARDVRALAASAGTDDLVRLHQGFSRAFDDIVRSQQPRGALEMALVRLGRRPPLVPIDDLVARLASLEQRLRGGAGAGPATGPALSRSSGAGAGGSGAGTSGGSGAGASGAPSGSSVGGSSRGPAPSGAPSGAPGPRPGPSGPRATGGGGAIGIATGMTLGRDNSGGGSGPSGTTAGAMGAAAVAMFPTQSAPSSVPARPSSPAVPAARVSQPGPFPSPSRPAPSADSAAPLVPPSIPPGVDLDAFRAVLAAIRSQRPDLASLLERAAPLAFNAERAVLGFEPDSFGSERATSEDAVDLLTRTVRTHFGAPTAVAFDLSANLKGVATVAMLDQIARRDRHDQARRAIAEHPLVKAAVDILGAELRDVRVHGDDS